MQMGIAFQPDLLGVMSQFSGFDAVLKKHIATATEKSAALIGTTGQGNMNFMNPSGVLHDSIEVRMQSEYEAWTGSAVVYAHRREFSFQGPDSLGRMFPNDPAMLMFTHALEDETMLLEVASNYIEAVYAAWNECMGKLPPGTMASVGVA